MVHVPAKSQPEKLPWAWNCAVLSPVPPALVERPLVCVFQ